MSYTIKKKEANRCITDVCEEEQIELRCTCGRKLFEASNIHYGTVDIKCSKCGCIMRITFRE